MDERRYREAEAALWTSMGLAPMEQFVASDGFTSGRIRVQEVGEGPPIVFVHGAMNAGASWASLVARLDGWRRIVVDRPGCGMSAPLDRRLADASDLDAFGGSFVVGVLDALGIERSHLIGSSFGGFFVLSAAARRPDRVDRVVTLGWSVGARIERTPPVMRIGMLPIVGKLMSRLPVNESMVRRMLGQIGLSGALRSGRFGPVELAWYTALLRDTATMRNEISGAPRLVTLGGFNETTMLSARLLERIVAPTYMLWGTDDPMGGEATARQFAGAIGPARLEMMPDAGHAPWMDDPDFVADRVRSFLLGA